MSNTYTNPLAGKAVALIGTFKSFKTAYAINVLKQIGAISHKHVVIPTDIVVVGANPGKKLDKVIKLGIEQWDEAQLVQAFADYNTHLQNQPNAGTFDPLVSAFQYGDELSYKPYMLYGLPIAHQIHEQFIGDHYAYSIDFGENADIWDYPGLDTIQALIIKNITDDTWAAFAQQLHRLPNLKALVINSVSSTQQPLDADQLLTALPQLESLFFSSHRFVDSGGIAFNVARHSSLQQLYINAKVVDGLSLVSLPKLRLLHVEESTLSVAIEGLKRDAYPQLNTIELFDLEDSVALLLKLPVAPQIQHLKLASRTWQSSASVRDVTNQLKQIALWSGTQQISHLEMTYLSLKQLAALKRKDFPKLTHLQLTIFSYRENEKTTPTIELWEGLHITLNQGFFADETILVSLIQTLRSLPAAASLAITQQYRTFTPEQEALFADLPYPVVFT